MPCCCVNYIMVSRVWGICKTPRPNLRVHLQFSALSFGHFISFCFGTISPVIAKSVLLILKLLLMSNGGKEQEKKNVFV